MITAVFIVQLLNLVLTLYIIFEGRGRQVCKDIVNTLPKPSLPDPVRRPSVGSVSRPSLEEIEERSNPQHKEQDEAVSAVIDSLERATSNFTS